MEIITKISVKNCKASPKMKLVEVDGKQVPRADGEQHLVRVIGVTNGMKRGTSEYGPWIAFLGSFEATNVQTGEVFRASKCLLPESATGALSVAVGSEDNTVEFAFDIGVKPASTPIGYEYTIKPLMAVSESDPLSMLKNKMAVDMPALPAPVKGALAAPAPQAEPEKVGGKKK